MAKPPSPQIVPGSEHHREYPLPDYLKGGDPDETTDFGAVCIEDPPPH